MSAVYPVRVEIVRAVVANLGVRLQERHRNETGTSSIERSKRTVRREISLMTVLRTPAGSAALGPLK